MNYAELYEIARAYDAGEISATAAHVARCEALNELDKKADDAFTAEDRRMLTMCVRIGAMLLADLHPESRHMLIIPDMPPPPTT